MKTIENTLIGLVNKEITLSLDMISRDNLSKMIVNWLENISRKRNVEDLPARINQWKEKIDKLAKNAVFSFDVITGVLKIESANDEDLQTLSGLLHGTTWFEPYDEFVEDVTTLAGWSKH